MISKNASAGTLESGDIMVLLEKGDNGIEIELTSTVEKLYGRQIREVISTTLKDLGITDIKVKASDRGALDCTIRARVMTAFYRAIESTDFKWS